MAEKEWVERGAALKALRYYYGCSTEVECDPDCPVTECAEGRIMMKLPAADVMEVVHGEWLYVSGKGRCAEYECSECREHVCFDEKIDGTIPTYKGCPHCLAVMDGGKHETD